MPVNTAAAVHAESLVRRFGATTAVDGLSFEVRGGETFGLLGHNGAGKTTTIRLLNGVLGRDAGAVEVLGLDPQVDGVGVRLLVQLRLPRVRGAPDFSRSAPSSSTASRSLGLPAARFIRIRSSSEGPKAR